MALLALTTLIVFILTLYSIRSMDLPEFKDVSNTDEVECHYENHTAGDLRVMTFNIWYNGKQVDDGIEKIAKHINIVNPDAVCLQEVSTLHDLDRILDAAGEKWNAVSKPSVYADVAIMTRHQILNETFISGKFVGATIESENGRKIRIVNGHLQYKMYGIYAAFNKLVTNISQIMDGEINPQNFSRMDNIKRLLNSQTFQQWVLESDKIPLFVCGDFNAPSHLDWVESTKNIHAGWVFKWPVTELLETKTGLSDAYRIKHPNPAEKPGITWSTVTKFMMDWPGIILEPHDRIDFIYFKESLFDVINAFTYCGNSTLKIYSHPEKRENDYPSDHYAVVVDFNFKKTLNMK